MTQLNFPNYTMRYKKVDGQHYIFDIIRKKFVVSTPEEVVRQHLIHFLIEDREFPKALINVEKVIIFNKMKRRPDVMVYDAQVQPLFIAECKAPYISISQETFEQVATYNLVLQAPYLFVTNGLQHFCCKLDLKNRQFEYIGDIPIYSKLL